MKQNNDDIKNDMRLNLRSEKTRRFIVESLPFLVRYGTLVIAIIVSLLFLHHEMLVDYEILSTQGFRM